MRWAPGVTAGQIPGPAVTADGQSPGTPAQLVVLLDAAQRPQSLVLRGADGLPAKEKPITLRALVGTPLTHLARQVSSRPAAHRYDPVVCTSADGGYLGVVDIDALLRVLADQVDSLARVPVPTLRVE